MNTLKYLAGGVIFIILSIVADVAQGKTLTINQASLISYGITVVIAIISFVIAEQFTRRSSK
jgi:hypothetical protein